MPRSIGPFVAALDKYAAERRVQFYPKADCRSPDKWLTGLRCSSEEELGIRPQDLKAACGAALGGAAGSIKPLAEQGTFHRLYRVEREGSEVFILRVGLPKIEIADGGMLIEARIADKLRLEGLPACEVIHVDLRRTLCPFDFQISKAAKGQPLVTVDSDEGRMLQLLTILGRTMSRYHELDISANGYGFIDPRVEGFNGVHARWTDYLGVRLAHHIKECRRLDAINDREAEEIKSAFDDPSLNKVKHCLLHGDPSSANVFFLGDAITALIDWEDALIGDPLFDLAFCASFHPDRRHEPLLSGYCGGYSYSTDFLKRFWLYFLRIALAKTVLRARFGYADQPGRVPAAQRIRLALRKLRENQLLIDQ